MIRTACALSAFVLLAWLTACGGSSSETPFPLEPDLSRLDGGPSAESRFVVYTSKQKKKADVEASDEGAPEPEPER
ncbi:MAG: hypothetical protein HYZ29_00105 [Myxococcales bacterium]|nr:hypothetical protein [Myxococcales bacterium]